MDRRINKSPIKSEKLKEMIRSNSNVFINNLAASSFNETKLTNKSIENQKPRSMRLYLFGKYEIFGIEEIVDMQELRSFTVVCSSTIGRCYKMPRDHFQDIVN